MKVSDKSEPGGSNSVIRIASVATTLASVALIIAGLALVLGWGFGIEAFIRVMPEYPAMVPETGLCIAIAAAGVVLLVRQGGNSVFPRICGVLVLMVAGLAIVKPVSVPSIRETDEMSVATVSAIALSASVLISSALRGWHASVLRQLLASFGLAVSFIPLLGYFFDADSLFSNPVYTSMAIHTAFSMVLLFLALLIAESDYGWVGTLLAPENGSGMARRILPVLVSGPILLCGLALKATENELVSVNLRLAVLAFAMIAITVAAALWFAHVTNLSERRAAAMTLTLRESERARQESELAAVRAQKVEAMGQLVGGVAHDFNNTLTVILGNLEMLEEDPDTSARSLYIKEAIDASNHAARLTRQLLAYGRKSRLEPMPHVLDDQVEETLTMFRRICPANIELSEMLAASTFIVNIDRSNFQQALLNILINARDALPDGGEITIATRSGTPGESRVAGFGENETLPPGVYGIVSVTDNGAGMEPDIAERAPEPFFTTKGVGEGTGLGLAMVAGFCRQSGGGLRIESESGRGATVTMIFPGSEQLPARPVPGGADPGGTNAGSILLVDDELQVARVVARQLQLDGFSVRIASDARQALEMLDCEPLPDLMLSDLVMPGEMQGHALAETVQGKYPAVRILLMSGYESARRRREISALDGITFLQKPIDRSTLRQAVAEALNRP